jgi:hypothetical protein
MVLMKESIIGGLGLLLNFILVYKANATMFVVKYPSMSILHAQLVGHREIFIVAISW